MAEINGAMLICERCGATAFRKCIGEGERDGGFTRWNKFEPKPEGWGWHSETGDICPACEKEFRKILEDFKRLVGEFNANNQTNQTIQEIRPALDGSGRQVNEKC